MVGLVKHHPFPPVSSRAGFGPNLEWALRDLTREVARLSY